MNRLRVSILHLRFFDAAVAQESRVIHLQKLLQAQRVGSSRLAALVHSQWCVRRFFLKVFHARSFARQPSPRERPPIETMEKFANESFAHNLDPLQYVCTDAVFYAHQGEGCDNDWAYSPIEKRVSLQAHPHNSQNDL